MTTRSFIKSLALLSGAAVGCPGIFIPKFEPVRWKVLRQKYHYFISAPAKIDPALLTYFEFRRSLLRFEYVWKPLIQENDLPINQRAD